MLFFFRDVLGSGGVGLEVYCLVIIGCFIGYDGVCCLVVVYNVLFLGYCYVLCGFMCL